MPSELTQLIELGHDITTIKYYGIATTTIFFYEYFAMLPDEIQYAWSSNKTWVFYLFLLNRYIPVAFQFWILNVSYRQDFSQELYGCVLPLMLLETSHLSIHRCNRTSFVAILAFVLCTLVAQVVLTLRVYAVTGRSKPIAAVFAVITASQLALGIFLTSLTATHAAGVIPPIPFDGFILCAFSRHRKTEVAYTAISLGYDLLAFLIILYLAGRWFRQFGLRGLLGTILRDATKYFLVIFTAHLALTLTLLFARPSLQLLPAPGNVVYLSVMITRLMISLRKAAYSQGSPWSMGESTISRAPDRETYSMQFASNCGPSNRRGDDTLVSPVSPGV